MPNLTIAQLLVQNSSAQIEERREMSYRFFTLEGRVTYILGENFLLRQRFSKLEMYIYFLLFYNFVFFSYLFFLNIIDNFLCIYGK